jgi:hypothetical protein
MTQTIPVFVNAERTEVPPGVTVLDALRIWSEGMAREVEAGSQRVLDSRGLPVALDEPVHAGSIFRLITARDARDAAADDDLL